MAFWFWVKKCSHKDYFFVSLIIDLPYLEKDQSSRGKKSSSVRKYDPLQYLIFKLMCFFFLSELFTATLGFILPYAPTNFFDACASNESKEKQCQLCDQLVV